MPEEVTRRLRHAQSASRIGAVCMYAMAAALCIISVASCCAFAGQGVIPPAPLARPALSTVTTVCLAEFLRNFRQEASPFGRGQATRVALAGLLLLSYALLDLFGPATSYRLDFMGEAMPVAITSQPGINPMMLSLSGFFLCLALVVRYGDALKEDLDGIA